MLYFYCCINIYFVIKQLLCFTGDVNNAESQQLDLGPFIVVGIILTIISFVAMLNVGSSTVLDRWMRIIGRMVIFIYSLVLLMMVVLKQYEFISLIIAFHFCFALILAVTMTSLLLWSCFRCSSSKEYEGGEYENAKMCDDEGSPEHEVHYYYDLVAMNNNGTTDREQQQHKQKENQHTLYSAV